MVAGLPTVTLLSLTSDINKRFRMPRCQELASLRSTSLQALDVQLYQVLLGLAHAFADKLSKQHLTEVCST